MNATRRFELPLLAAGQAQKEITHNEAVLAIDRLLHLIVESRSRTDPPAEPLAGTAFLVPPAATGVWSGRAGQIASHDGFGWTFTAPVRGMVAFIADEDGFAVIESGGASAGWPVKGLRIAGRQVLAAAPATVVEPVGGAVVDNECRSTINALIVALQSQGILA